MTPGISGGGATKVLLLSESHEDQSHFLLDRLIRRAGFQKDHFYFGQITNPDVLHEAARLGVKVVMPLGERALRFATGEPGILRWRGRVITSATGMFTLPTFRPSRLFYRRVPKGAPPDPETLRNPPRYQKSFLRDLHYGVYVAKNGFERKPVNYLLDPSAEEFWQWVKGFAEAAARNPELLLSYDIETPYKQEVVEEDELEESEAASDLNTHILRISFSYETHTGVTIPYLPQYHEAIGALLSHPCGKVVWNGLYFDNPVLEANGYRIEGPVFDGMDAWHFLHPQLDKGLEAVTADATDMLPWKHLSDSNPEWYSATDADAALRNVLYTHEKLKAQGAWETYLQSVVEVMTYMKEAGQRGTPLDVSKQQELIPLLDAETERLEALIAAEVPDELRPRKRYKKTPDVEVLEGWTDKRFSTRCGRVFVPVSGKGTIKRCSHCGETDVTSAKHFKSSIEKVEEVTKKGKVKVKNKRVPNPCKAAGAVIEKVPAEVQMWDELLPFNANSSSQLIAYMKHFGHPVGKNKKDPEVDAADAAHLQELVGMFGDDFPLYQLALDLHKVRKARTTYMPTPDAAGMIHTTYTNTPWTWRFGSRALNLQNWGKRNANKWAKVARLQIISRPGWVFVQADSSSAEAVIQGWYMADLQYIEKASKGIHTWLSTMKLGWDFTPETIEKVKAEHSDLYAAMKTTNYLINFGGSPYALHMGNKKMFPTKKSAEKMFDTIYALLPTLEAYHYNIRTLAHKQGYLVSPWNVKFDFFDVFTYARGRGGEILYTASGRPKLKLGKDGKAVVAAFPQHSNGMFSRENAVIIGRSEWRPYMPASFAVHDSYKLRVPKELEEKAVMFLADTLTRPIPQLGGLRLGCEVEVGENWGEFHEQKNPQGMKKVHAVTIDKQTLTHFPNFKEDLRKVAA